MATPFSNDVNVEPGFDAQNNITARSLFDANTGSQSGAHIAFDGSPTGLINGKFEKEVDFDYKCEDANLIDLAKENMQYIDRLCYSYIYGNR